LYSYHARQDAAAQSVSQRDSTANEAGPSVIGTQTVAILLRRRLDRDSAAMAPRPSYDQSSTTGSQDHRSNANPAAGSRWPQQPGPPAWTLRSSRRNPFPTPPE